jgi:hypothetical protein
MMKTQSKTTPRLRSLKDLELGKGAHVKNRSRSRAQNIVLRNIHGFVVILWRDNNYFIDNEHGIVLDDTCWLPSGWILFDRPAFWVRRITRDFCELQSQAVAQCHVTINTPNVYGIVRRDVVYPVLRGKWLASPVFLVPVTTEHPFTRFKFRHKVTNSLPKLIFTSGRVQLDVGKMTTANQDVNVRVYEPRHNQALTSHILVVNYNRIL